MVGICNFSQMYDSGEKALFLFLTLKVWRQKAQYLQHKQNKAEAMTVKRKTVTTSDSKSKGVTKAYQFTFFVLHTSYSDSRINTFPLVSLCICLFQAPVKRLV